MELADLRKKEIKELHAVIRDLQKKLSDIRFNFSSNKLKNVKEIGNMKKDIARAFTIIKEKERVL